MPRTARELSHSGVYHIVLRGVYGRPLLTSPTEFGILLEMLSSCISKHGVTFYAYCALEDHIHLLLSSRNEPGIAIKYIATSYVRRINSARAESGGLFSGRFLSEPVEDGGSFSAAVRHILREPVVCGVCSSPDEYPYSSFNELFGSDRNNCITDRDAVLATSSEDVFYEYVISSGQDTCMDKPRFIRITDEQAAELICKITGLSDAGGVRLLEYAERDELLGELRKAGLSVRQISRLTGIGKGTVERK